MQKHIIITGGSSGIGKGIAEHFYNKGWGVLITGRNKEKLQQAIDQMPGIITLEYDSLLDSDQQIIDFIKNNWAGSLDILVNNAGHVELGSLKDLSDTSMKQMYQSHLIGPALLASHCIDFLSKQKGQILNISSSHGMKAYADTSAYGSAKAALNFMTKIWALELAPLGIRVNAIAPGPTETGILNSAGFSQEMISMIHDSERQAIPLQRRGAVSDIVSNATAILDSGSAWLTGVIIPVDGGLSIS
jgi:NAD(P)-dependent dehydrogenase (short-subunit alcohol dehydrogenase family)